MSKAILVIDIPNCCEDCSLMWKDDYSDFCPVKCNKNKTDIYDYTHTNTKPDWCPLKPAPKRDEVYRQLEWGIGYKKGWNDCVNYVVGN